MGAYDTLIKARSIYHRRCVLILFPSTNSLLHVWAQPRVHHLSVHAIKKPVIVSAEKSQSYSSIGSSLQTAPEPRG